MSSIGTSTSSVTSASYYSYLSGNTGAAFVIQSFVDGATAFTASNVLIANDGPVGVLEYSWNGVNVHGVLQAGQSLTLNKISRASVYVRHQGATVCAFRVWGWS